MKTPFAPTLRRLLVCALAITAILTGVLLLTPEEAVAAPCCDTCDIRLENCLAGCGGLPICEDRCEFRAETCFNNCIEC